MNAQFDEIVLDDDVVKKFIYATLVWGAIAFLVGVVVALQLAYWPANFNLPWVSFGRLRPLHTNAAIFAFAGNAIFAGIYHSSQRLLKARPLSDLLSRLHFWGWQLIIVAAAITLPFGFSQSKEYAELEWPIDIAIAVVWVIFAVNFFGMIVKRKEKHMYVALWFYIATIVTVAVLHIVNSIEIPVAFLKSFPVYAGIQDAMVQWWYGHNAVAFFLTTPFLGLMYYYVPKMVNRPIYSYRLSIIHFWSLVFIYIWAGPHHLLYTSLPEWAQTLGMIFSVMLLAPSWGGMINGLLTLKGVWSQLRTDPILKFVVAALTFYGMATFEGPLMSIKSVSSLAHYTDWIVAHVHGGTLGWNGFLTFAIFYYLVPKLWNTTLYSKKWAEIHFWTGFLGIVLYYVSMTVAGVTQGMMWKAIGSDGRLVYPDFIETVIKIIPLYWVRAFAGTLFLAGFILMLVNIYKTIKSAPKAENSKVQVKSANNPAHTTLASFPMIFTVLTVLAILVGSIIEIYPTLFIQKYLPTVQDVKPYSPLELVGRGIYIKEGCYTCHSQQIRPLPEENLRYGERSTMAESIYDRPFQWGSKRTGPDLARVGKKYPDLWHFKHMMDPRSITAKSIMPSYPWLATNTANFMSVRKELSVMKYLGVPYSDEVVANGDLQAEAQAKQIAQGIEASGGPAGLERKEIVALIAYLQSLGQNKVAGAQP